MSISTSTFLRFLRFQGISHKFSQNLYRNVATKPVRLISYSCSATLPESREDNKDLLTENLNDETLRRKEIPNRRRRLTNTLNKILHSASKITTNSYRDEDSELVSSKKRRKGLDDYDHIFTDTSQFSKTESPIERKSNSKESLLSGNKESLSNVIQWTWAKPVHVQKKEIEGRKSDIDNEKNETLSCTGSFSSSYKIPVEIGVFLKENEITQALYALGGMDIKVVPLEEDLNMGEGMIFCSGRSGPHLRRLADALVKALRNRNLKQTVGYGGAEGYECDDWMIVDCETFIVQLMHPEKRAQLNLEEHWAQGNNRPFIPVTATLNEWEREIDKLLIENPLPEGYDISELARRAKDSDKILEKYLKKRP